MPRLLFDFPSVPGGAPVRRDFRNPVQVVRADSVAEVEPALRHVQAQVRAGCWAAGYLAYEAAPAFDPAFDVHADPVRPLIWFGIFRDGGTAITDSTATDRSGSSSTGGWTSPVHTDSPFGPWELEWTEEEFAERIRRIRAAIEAGETYQVNLTARMRSRLAASSFASLYERLRAAQGDGYHALLDLDERTVLSASPELFFQLRGRVVTTRPMKGTSPRGRWLEEDRAAARTLRGSEKERAENRMIVDLVRNDLGRICQVGSVEVTNALQVERYRTVLQMTSTVRGRISDDAGFVDVLAALFPSGSVTGAPKIHTMGLIADLETSTRDVYCGAVGYVEGGTGDAIFNVPIRTLWHERGSKTAVYGVGSGVTWGSTAEGEYAEFHAKARILVERWPSFSLLESLRLERGSLRRVDRHLARMAASAAYFDRPFPEASIRTALERTAAAHPVGVWKTRLVLEPDGEVRVSVEKLAGPETPADDGLPWKVALARTPVDSTDRFLFHKTTHREVYRTRLAERPTARDVLLFNETGHITEFTRGNVVVEIDGRLVTPPRSSGLLAGCFRAELLDVGTVEEGVVLASDLGQASEIWLINSVREWIPVSLELQSRAPASTGRVPP